MRYQAALHSDEALFIACPGQIQALLWPLPKIILPVMLPCLPSILPPLFLGHQFNRQFRRQFNRQHKPRFRPDTKLFRLSRIQLQHILRRSCRLP